jgi:predicted transcriptional regulator
MTEARYTGKGFVTIPRQVLFNPGISDKAKLILMYLLDKQGLPHWKVNEKHIAEVYGWNPSTVAKYVQELKNYGFVHIHQERCRGRIVGTTWHYSESALTP